MGTPTRRHGSWTRSFAGCPCHKRGQCEGMTRWIAGFIAGASSGLVAGAWLGALLTAAAYEAIGRAVTLPQVGRVVVPDSVPEAWTVDR